MWPRLPFFFGVATASGVCPARARGSAVVRSTARWALGSASAGRSLRWGQRAMQELAPRAIGFRLGFAHGGLKRSAEDGLVVVLALELRAMLVAPMDAQDFLERVTGRLAAGTVERRDAGGVFYIAHESRSSARRGPSRHGGARSNCRARCPRCHENCGDAPDRGAGRAKPLTAPTPHGVLASARSTRCQSPGTIRDRLPFARHGRRVVRRGCQRTPRHPHALVNLADIRPEVSVSDSGKPERSKRRRHGYGRRAPLDRGSAERARRRRSGCGARRGLGSCGVPPPPHPLDPRSAG